MRAHLPVFVLLGASVLWGLSWLPLKGINAMGIDGIVLIFIVYGILSLVFTPLLLKQFTHYKHHPKAMFLIALFGGGASLAFTYALINGEVIRVMVLFYLLPLWGVLGGKFFLREQIDRWRYLGAALAIGGAFIILGGFEVFDSPLQWIDLIALLSGLFFTMNNLVFRAAQEVKVGAKIGAMFYGTFTLAALLLLGGVESLPEFISTQAWSGLFLYALLWLLLANLGSQWGVTHMEAGRSSIIIIMELLTAVVSATLIAGEIMNAHEYFGGVLIVAAAFIEALRTKDDNIPKTTI
ncbi:MAG: DMT family transporter [Sulfurimonas sp.]|nr:DMT family transporter [Sulfurimonas sp.]MBU3938960.1 DMT family transporter [bacterium]MBU4025829.1 DMT family transporter [bacterium]MBU4057888.1 DMT family transporter [bacterium]MBU4109556.1 DMT family transporter [bacterium]